MRWVWVVIPLVLIVSMIGIVGVQESFADDVLMDFNEWQNDLNRFVTLSDTKISLSNYNSENNNVISELGNSFYWPKFNMTFPEQVKIGESFDVVLDYTYVIPDEDTRNYADPEEICPPVYCERQNIWIVIPTYVDYLNDDRIYESTPSDPRHTPIRTWNLYSLDPPFDNTKPLQETFTFVINKPDIDYPYGFIDISFHGSREAIFYFNAAQDGIVYFDDKVMQSIGDGPGQLKDTPISSIITTREERLAAGPVDGPPKEIWDQFKDYLIEQHSGEDIREMLLGSNIKLSWIDRFLKFYPEFDTQSFSSEKDLIFAEDFDEIANKIESDSRFERFSSHVLDAIRAGEIDEYKIRLIISKAPQDVGSYGSYTNVAKLLDIIENEMGLETTGSGSANISLIAPVESLEELAKYPYVERIIGKDFGIKHVSEDKTRGIIKYSYDENVYDIPYNVTNAKVKIFTEFGVRLTTNDYGILQMSYPIELTDTITNAYGNVTLTSFIENAGDINDGFQVLELNDEHISFQWDFIHDDGSPFGPGLGFFSTVTVSGSKPITEDVQHDSLKHQIRMGVTSDEINCKEGLELIFKPSNNSPACVKPSTVEKLIQRGWAIS